MDLITAEGEFVRASERENADLFWGVRGGGGNFGIVTEFEFRLNPLGPQVMAGPVFWPIEEAPKVLRFYRDWIADCTRRSDDAGDRAQRAPAIDGMPSDLVGERVIAVVCCYAGAVEEGEKVLRPIKGFGAPALDLCEPRPFIEHQQMYDPSFEAGWHYYFRSCDVAELNDDIIDIMVEHGQRVGSPISSAGIWQLGGAVARVGEDETAFNGRGAGHTFNINGNSRTAEGFDEEREWARGLWTALEPYHTSVYVNFMMDEGEERVRQAYGPAKYERLKALKRTYDPDNFFRLNQNIPPT